MPLPRRSKALPRTSQRAFASLDRLRAYLTARATLTQAELEFVQGLFAPRHLRKGEFLQQAGGPAHQMAFVARGCLRSYVIDHKGKVHTLSFAPEDWWVSDSVRYLGGERGALFIDAVETSDLLLIDHQSHERMMNSIPALAAAYQAALQRLAAARDKRIINSLSASAQERYLDFTARYPTLLRRVPLRMLASYLGMSPETLSRIRSKLATGTSAARR